MSISTEKRTELIESKLDKGVAGSLSVKFGGMEFRDMAEVMEFAKLMSISGQAVRPHLRNNPGACLAIAIQALEWRMSPFAVANKSYVVNDVISYESQLIHAVIEQRAPITARLQNSFSGSGETRRCKVWATPKNESQPLSYESPEFKTITPKNSPLWKTKPDLQLYYNTSRDWARMYFPDVILGVYAEDELDHDYIDSAPVKRISSLDDLTNRLTKPEPEKEISPESAEAPDLAALILSRIQNASNEKEYDAAGLEFEKSWGSLSNEEIEQLQKARRESFDRLGLG